MGNKICKNHPGRTAVGICATCHIPICQECAVKSPALPKQIFCSKEHMQQFLAFEESGRGNIPRIRNRSIFARVGQIVVALVGIYIVLHVMGWVPRFLPLPFYDMF